MDSEHGDMEEIARGPTILYRVKDEKARTPLKLRKNVDSAAILSPVVALSRIVPLEP